MSKSVPQHTPLACAHCKAVLPSTLASQQPMPSNHAPITYHAIEVSMYHVDFEIANNAPTFHPDYHNIIRNHALCTSCSDVLVKYLNQFVK